MKISIITFLLGQTVIRGDSELQSVEIAVDGTQKLHSIESAERSEIEMTFENLMDESIEYYWDPPNGEPVIYGTLKSNEQRTVRSWPGHRWMFTPIGSNGSKKIIFHQIVADEATRWIPVSTESVIEVQKRIEEKQLFLKRYYKETGRQWLNYWPRDPVIHHYHRVDQIGDIIKATTDRSQFHQCKEGQLTEDDITTLDAMQEFDGWTPNSKAAPPSFQTENDRYFIGRINGTTYCRRKVDGIDESEPDQEEMVSWNLTNICNEGPNAFRIYNFLSDDEMEHIIELGQHLGLFRSLAGDQLSDVRTSQQVWLSRSKSFIIDNVIRRIGDMVNISQSQLFKNASAEELQLVHYFGGELYKAHIDYLTDKEHCRYITFLMYLNDVKEGGNTSFPKANERCRDENGYFGVQPIKGSVVFFYDLFPDGNVDERTQHYAEPPVDSEKWMTNLWIWDKVFAG